MIIIWLEDECDSIWLIRVVLKKMMMMICDDEIFKDVLVDVMIVMIVMVVFV